MQNAMWLGFFAAVLLIYIHRPKWGAMALLVATMLCPFGDFSRGGATTLLRVELALTPLILGMQLLGIPSSSRSFRLSPVTALLALWILWLGIVSVLGDREINFVAVYGYARFVGVVALFANIDWTDEDIEQFQFLCVFTCIPIAMLSLGQVLGIGAARELTEVAYSPASASVIAEQMKGEALGYTFRAVGVFGNVSPTGAYFVATLTLAVLLYGTAVRNYRFGKTILLGGLVSSIAGGASAISATFIGGSFPAVAIMLGFSPPGNRRRIVIGVMLLIAVTIGGMQWARSTSDTVDLLFQYQWQKLTGGEGLTDRYSAQDGVLADAYEEFMRNPWMGMGVTKSDTFVGDSLYMLLLYCSGYVGGIIFGVAVLLLTLMSFRKGIAGRMALTWTILMLVTGVGCTSMFAGRLGDWWWAMQGVLISQAASPRNRAAPLSHLSRSRRAPVRAPQDMIHQPLKPRSPGSRRNSNQAARPLLIDAAKKSGPAATSR